VHRLNCLFSPTAYYLLWTTHIQSVILHQNNLSRDEILTDEPYDTVNDLARPGFLFVDLFRTGCLCSELPFGPCRQADDDGGRRDP
jgi:hypothetical protein